MLDEIIEEFKKLKEYYVYTLVDERNGAVFYVGKGAGERAHHHGKEAGSSDTDTEKLNKIREIEKSGYSVILRVIGRYETEAEAFAVESTLMHWMYGIDNLTNRQNGHGSDSIRSKGNFETIEGIDILKRISLVDGTYSREYIPKEKKMELFHI